MTRIEGAIIAAILAVLGAIGYGAYQDNVAHPCIRQHRGMVHHEAWMQYMYIDKTMYPMFHPAYDAEGWICDERTK